MIYFPLAINSSSEFDVDYSRVRISLNERQMYSYSFQCVKVALSFQINKYHKTNILRNYLTYIMINAYNEGICVEFWRKEQHNLGLTSFKLPASTNNLLRLTRWILCLTSSVYDYQDIGPSSIVYILHNFISSVWLWRTDEYVLFYFERKFIFKNISWAMYSRATEGIIR